MHAVYNIWGLAFFTQYSWRLIQDTVYINSAVLF